MFITFIMGFLSQIFEGFQDICSEKLFGAKIPKC